MQYVRLGRTGVQVSRICLGCMSFGNGAPWMIELDESRNVIKKALDLGINFFDTANVYSLGRSEQIIGGCLKDLRDDVVMATKVGVPMSDRLNDTGLSRRHIMKEIRASLERLQVDHVDLYQVHRWDNETSIEETMKSLDEIVRHGMAYYIGASNMSAWQFLKSLHASERLGLEKFVSMQNHYNLVYREEEREMIPLCKEEGIALLPYSPLARGFLTGKYRRGETPKAARYDSDWRLARRYFKPEDYDILERVEVLAKDKGVTSAQVALAWMLHKDVASVIIGATKIEHLEEAVAAFDIRLNAEEIQSLETLYKPHQPTGLSLTT